MASSDLGSQLPPDLLCLSRGLAFHGHAREVSQLSGSPIISEGRGEKGTTGTYLIGNDLDQVD